MTQETRTPETGQPSDLPIPAEADGALTDAELDQVAGGTGVQINVDTGL
jgi:hypothetical protein